MTKDNVSVIQRAKENNRIFPNTNFAKENPVNFSTLVTKLEKPNCDDVERAQRQANENECRKNKK